MLNNPANPASIQKASIQKIELTDSELDAVAGGKFFRRIRGFSRYVGQGVEYWFSGSTNKKQTRKAYDELYN